MSTSRTSQTLALWRSAPGKPGTTPGLYREASSFGVASSRSGIPVPTRWTFTSAFLASVHCPSASLRHSGFACFRSPLMGTGIPALVNNGCCRKPGAELTGPAGRLVLRPRPPPSLPPGGRKPPMSISRSVRTLASHACAPGKPGTTPGLSVKLAASRRQEAANEHQHKRANLGFACLCPRKAGQEALSFRKASSFREASPPWSFHDTNRRGEFSQSLAGTIVAISWAGHGGS